RGSYPLAGEKLLPGYETLGRRRGEAGVPADWTAQEVGTAAEFIDHARKIRAERERAAREGRKPQLADLMRQWGGATIVYRRRLIDSPSYTLNHEEVAKALEEGIGFAEQLTPQEGLLDRFGCARALKLSAPAEGSTRPEPGSSARAALASEASGQRGDSIVRAHSASEDARERTDDTRPEPGSSARAALTSEASGQRGDSIVCAHSASEDAR